MRITNDYKDLVTYKLRSVRISQGDTVFGLRGGGENAPQFIIREIPRTIYKFEKVEILQLYQDFGQEVVLNRMIL